MGVVDNMTGNLDLKGSITDNHGNFKNANFEGKMNIFFSMVFYRHYKYCYNLGSLKKY